MTNIESLNDLFDDNTYEAIFNQMGYEWFDIKDEKVAKDLIEDIRTIQNYGIESGIHGFINSCDVKEFFNKNEWEIKTFVNCWGYLEWFRYNKLSVLLDTLEDTDFYQIATYKYVEHKLDKLDIDSLIIEETQEEEKN